MEILISPDQRAAIQQVPGFSESTYKNIDVAGALDFFKRRYVDQLAKYIDIENSPLCDCAAGYGWLSFAYVLSGGHSAVVVEYNSARLQSAKRIAEILNITDRCSFVCAGLHAMPFPRDCFKVLASVETIEHVGGHRIAISIQEMDRIATQIILLTTPNKLFPIDLHDTSLPIAHWLPKRARHYYAKICRAQRSLYNDFVSPMDLNPLRRTFTPVTSVQTFSNMRDWRASYPHYSPYGSGSKKKQPPLGYKIYLRITSTIMGHNAYMVNPNMSCIWRSRNFRNTL